MLEREIIAKLRPEMRKGKQWAINKTVGLIRGT